MKTLITITMIMMMNLVNASSVVNCKDYDGDNQICKYDDGTCGLNPEKHEERSCDAYNEEININEGNFWASEEACKNYPQYCVMN